MYTNHEDFWSTIDRLSRESADLDIHEIRIGTETTFTQIIVGKQVVGEVTMCHYTQQVRHHLSA